MGSLIAQMIVALLLAAGVFAFGVHVGWEMYAKKVRANEALAFEKGRAAGLQVVKALLARKAAT